MPDNIGLLYHRHLAMFGPREMLLSSQEPVVRQFLNAQRVGPIGMSEEKDAERAGRRAGDDGDCRRCRRSRCSSSPARRPAARADPARGRVDWCRGQRRHAAARVVPAPAPDGSPEARRAS